MKRNAFPNGRYGPTTGLMSGRFPSIGSATSGHSRSSATAPAEARSSAPTPTPRTAASTAYTPIAPTSRQSRSERATTIDATAITAAKKLENAAATTALAARTSVRFGTAMNVVRIMPLRYSLVTVSADRIISTGTPKTATPIAALSGASEPGTVDRRSLHRGQPETQHRHRDRRPQRRPGGRQLDALGVQHRDRAHSGRRPVLHGVVGELHVGLLQRGLL